MQIAQSEVERRMARFESICRQEGIKLTHQRIEIFREVAQTCDHPDAEMIYSRVRRRMPTVSLDTVYRTLWMLEDLGLITTLGTNRDRTRFDANLENHHHFVCRLCGYTRDFYSDELDSVQLPPSLQSLGSIEGTHVEVLGICRKCEEKS